MRRRLAPMLALAIATTVALSASVVVEASPVEWPATFLTSTSWVYGGITADAAGHAYVTYSVPPAGGSTVVATNKTGVWTYQSIYSATPGPSSIRVDGTGAIHVVSNCAYFTNRSGTWQENQLPCGSEVVTGAQTRLVVDDLGEVHAVVRAQSGDILYMTNRRGYWLGEILGTTGDVPSIGLDANHRVHVVAAAQYISNASGSWQASTIPFVGTGAHSLIAVQGAAVRVLATTSAGLELASLSGSAWTITNLGAGTYPVDFQIDANGKSHALVDTGSGDDYLTDTSGSWSRTQGVAAAGLGLAISAGHAPAALVASGLELRYATSTPSGWARAKLTDATFAGSTKDLAPSIAAGANGTVRAAYTWPPGTGPGGVAAPGLYVSSWSGSAWGAASHVTTSDDAQADIAIDAQGHSHVVLLRPAGGNDQWLLMYGSDATGAWVWSQVDAGSHVDCPRLALGPTGHAFIVYSKWASGYPAYLATDRTGSWVSATLLPGQSTPPGSAGGACGSVAADSSDRVHVIYVATAGLTYVTDLATQGTYAIDKTWAGGWTHSLALDGSDKAHVLYSFGEGFRSTTDATGAWVEQDLVGATPPFANSPTSAADLGLTSAGPIAAWDSPGLAIVESIGAGWSSTLLTGSTAAAIDLAVAPNGTTFVLYAEQGSGAAVYTFVR